jgi:hypothetical protein
MDTNRINCGGGLYVSIGSYPLLATLIFVFGLALPSYTGAPSISGLTRDVVLDLTDDRQPQVRLVIEANTDDPGMHSLGLPFEIEAPPESDIFHTWPSIGGCCSMVAFHGPLPRGRHSISLNVSFDDIPGAEGRFADLSGTSSNPILLREGLVRTLFYNRQPDRASYDQARYVEMLEHTRTTAPDRVVVLRPWDSTMNELNYTGTGVLPEPASTFASGFVFPGLPGGDENAAIRVRYSVAASPALELAPPFAAKVVATLLPLTFGLIYTTVIPSDLRKKRFVLVGLISVSAFFFVVWTLVEIRNGYRLDAMLEQALVILVAMFLGSVGYLQSRSDRRAQLETQGQE